MKSDDEGDQSTRNVQDEEEEGRGEYECREVKFHRDLRQLEEKRRAQEEETQVVWRESRKEQLTVKWTDCSDDEQEGQKETAEEREERQVREEERLRKESEERAKRKKERREAAGFGGCGERAGGA